MWYFSYYYLILLYSSSLTASSHSLELFSPGSPFTSSLHTSFARLKAAFCCAIMLNEIVVNMMNIAFFFIPEIRKELPAVQKREIRLSERRFYQKLTDIYATAVDYNKDVPTTCLFYKKVQNKMHYAVHGHTAAELIVERANAEKEYMGLTTWEIKSSSQM